VSFCEIQKLIFEDDVDIEQTPHAFSLSMKIYLSRMPFTSLVIYNYIIFKYYVCRIIIMGTLTIVLKDETENMLRRIVKQLYGSSRGGLSEVIDNAVRSYIARLEASSSQRSIIFRAFKGETLVIEAKNLDELAAALRDKGVDPRGLRIMSSQGVRPVARAGIRARRQ